MFFKIGNFLFQHSLKTKREKKKTKIESGVSRVKDFLVLNFFGKRRELNKLKLRVGTQESRTS